MAEILSGIGNKPLVLDGYDPEKTTWETECGRMARLAYFAASYIQDKNQRKNILSFCEPYRQLGLLKPVGVEARTVSVMELGDIVR